MNAGELAEDLAQVMARQLRLRGGSLADVTTRAGTRLPKHLRAEADVVIEAARLSENPKLTNRVDANRLKTAEKNLRKFLDQQDPRAERLAEFLDRLAAVVFVLFVIALAVFFLAWSRGYFG